MALQLTTIQSIEAYFTALATGVNGHKEIDGIKFGEGDVLKEANRTGLEGRFIHVSEYDRAQATGTSDNLHVTKEIKIGYYKKPVDGTWANQQLGKQQCENVIKQIIAKLITDKQAGVINTRIENYSWELGMYEIGSTQYCGCELTITFMDNTGFSYDATKWN